MILVISSERDSHASTVLDALARIGAQATLLDLSRFPKRMQLSINYRHPDSNDHRIRVDGDSELKLADWWRVMHVRRERGRFVSSPRACVR